MPRPDFDAIAAALRASIERQIATTPEGKELALVHPRALAKLVTNIVGNLTYAVDNLIEAAAPSTCGEITGHDLSGTEYRCDLDREHVGPCHGAAALEVAS